MAFAVVLSFCSYKRANFRNVTRITSCFLEVGRRVNITSSLAVLAEMEVANSDECRSKEHNE
eukprot:6634281-Ditylum_brightwellii.AAC.1